MTPPFMEGAVELLGGPAWDGDPRGSGWLRSNRPSRSHTARPEIHIPGTFPTKPGNIPPKMSKITDKSGGMGSIVAEMSAILDIFGEMVLGRGARTRVRVAGTGTGTGSIVGGYMNGIFLRERTCWP